MIAVSVLDTAPLGKTALRVTKVGFGTSGLGDMPDTYGYRVEEDRARATIRAIFDGPAKLLDTSRNYGFGRSEERIGAVIRERGGLPEGFVISTKLDRDMETGRSGGLLIDTRGSLVHTSATAPRCRRFRRPRRSSRRPSRRPAGARLASG